MIVRKAICLVVAAAAIAAAAGVAVVALAFALYALVEPSLGSAGAAGVVAGAAALLILAVGLIALLMVRPPKRKQPEPDLLQRVIGIARDKPVIAAAAALAAGFFVVKNPQALMAIALALLEPKGGKKA